MDDISATLHRLGVPSSIIAALAVAWIVIREFKPFHRPPRRSDREILSQDEQGFRQSIMDELAALRAECRALKADTARVREELAQCEVRHSDLSATLARFIAAAKEGTLHLLLEGFNLPPVTLADLDLEGGKS